MLPHIRSARKHGFRKDRNGGVAIIFALALVPLLLGVGAAVDYTRAARARATMQQALDSAALAVATSSDTSQATLESIATNFVMEKDWTHQLSSTSPVQLQIGANENYTLTFTGTVETSFMKLAGINSVAVDVMAKSVRAVTGQTEIALVLDTTGSMSGTKMATLKQAATDMVNTIYADAGASSVVRMSVVPFAQYVNIGVSRRNEPWANVPADYSTTKNQCSKSKPLISKSGCTTVQKTCTSTNDGVTTSYACSSETCTSYVYGEEVTTCKDVTSNYKFRGCIGSRSSPYQLTDADATMVRYPGFLNVNCSKELLPLTNSKTSILAKINELSASGETYIPAGLIWGLNVLSPGVPFSEGAAYDSGNKKPRKVLVLMTDGENTKSVKYPAGTHDGGKNATANVFTADICANIKANKIEIYTVAFQVSDSDTLSMLASCATDSAHVYNATDSAALVSAFSEISKSLRTARLTE